MAISGTKAKVSITSASVTTSTNQAATLSTDGVTLQVNTTARRHWDIDSATHPIVFGASTSVALSSTTYTINFVQGIVTFSTPHSTAITYTMDTHWVTASSFANANQWSLSVDAGLIETNVFGSTWKTHISGLRAATISIQGFTPVHGGSTNPTVYDYINADTRGVVELFPSAAAGDKYEAYVWLSGNQIQAQVDAAITESVDAMVHGTLYYSTSP